MTKKIVVCISGTGSTLRAIVAYFANPSRKTEIVLVIADTADAVGLQVASAHNIPTQVVQKSTQQDRRSYCRALGDAVARVSPALVVLAGFMSILSAAFVDRWRGKVVNIHPSLLPKYRGLSTHQRALENNDPQHGTTVHYVSEELDAGPIIMQARCSLADITTVEAVKARVQVLERALYPLAIADCLRGEYDTLMQQPTVVPKLLHSDTYICNLTVGRDTKSITLQISCASADATTLKAAERRIQTLSDRFYRRFLDLLQAEDAATSPLIKQFA